jgi:Tfp pilus assembly protein PilN
VSHPGRNCRRGTLIFQDSIGIDIKQDEVVLAYLKQSFRGVRLAAHSVYSMESGKSQKEKLDALPSFIGEFKDENQIPTSNLVMGLSNEKVILREIEYPLAVKENLRSTLDYDIDKYIPLSADEIYFDYQVIEEDRANNRLKILLAMMKKTDCEPYLSFCRKWPSGVYGLCLSAVGTANCYAFLSGDKKYPLNKRVREILMKGEEILSDESVFQPSSLRGANIPSPNLIPAFGLAVEILWEVPVRINLLPVEVRKKPSRIGQFTLIGLIALLILSGAAWGGGHLFRQQMRVRAIEEEAKRLSSEVATVTKMQERIKEIEEHIEILKGVRGGGPSLLDMLKELTEIIPETAWVKDFRLTDKGISLEGYAESASELITLLEGSPLFENVVFNSAVRSDAKEEKESFSISLQPVGR